MNETNCMHFVFKWRSSASNFVSILRDEQLLVLEIDKKNKK